MRFDEDDSVAVNERRLINVGLINVRVGADQRSVAVNERRLINVGDG
jgi:hypothetical protein